MVLVEKAVLWLTGFFLILAAIALTGLCVYLLLRFLLSRTSGQRERREPVSLLPWLRRFILFLSRLRLRLAGLQSGRDGYRALLGWASRSGLQPVPAQTASELGARLQRSFPPLRAEIGAIVEAFNAEVYGEVVLPGGRMVEVRSAWRRLRSPRQWPMRIRGMWRGE